MFKKILIANRGEIACRIIKTAHKLGIKTVAIYSEIEKNALHVMMADEAYCIGPALSKESYLCGEKIVDLAKKCKVDAIHPGYGFLSENSEFAKRCEHEKIIFIGPSAKAIAAMGSKSTAKSIMEEARVPILPGYHGANQDAKFLLKQAKNIGFPIILKPVAGGGGKGMLIINQENEFFYALESAKREAKNNFNNEDLLVEKYLTNPRHIEMQIFADNYGNFVHLYERDCSIQRRHQKIIEEAPANISETTRKKMASIAINAAKAIYYTGAGTIEFLMVIV